MNLPEFRALLAEFALTHPERPLAEVTVVEFAEWQSNRIRAQTCRVCFGRKRDHRGAGHPFEAQEPIESAPDLIIFDEVHELKTSRAVEKMCDYAERHGYAAKQTSYTFRMTEGGGKILQDFSRKLNPRCEYWQSCDPYSAEPLAHYPDCPAASAPCAHNWVPWQEATANLEPLDRCTECRETRERLARGHKPR